MTGRPRLWGIDGDLLGNEGELFACLPILELTLEGRSVWAVARGTRWDPETGAQLAFLHDSEEAAEVGTKLDSRFSEGGIEPGSLVCLIGTALRSRLEAFWPRAVSEFAEWSEATAQFRVALRTPEEFAELADSAASVTRRSFDEAIRAGETNNGLADRLVALRGIPNSDPDEFFRREAALALATRDYEKFKQTVAVMSAASETPVEGIHTDLRAYLRVSAPDLLQRIGVHFLAREDRSFLEELGAEPDAFIDDSAALRAIQSFRSFAAIYGRSSVSKVARQTHYQAYIHRYPDEVEDGSDALHEPQKELLRKVGQLRLGVLENQPADAYSDPFEEILHETKAQTAKSLYLFPFFDSRRRRTTHAVIPWGRQTRLGLLVSSDHPSYRWVVHQQPERGGHGFRVSEDLAPRLVRDLRDQTISHAGKVFHERGYVIDQVFSELLNTVSAEAERTAVTFRNLSQVNRGAFVRRAFRRAGSIRAVPGTPSVHDLVIFDWAEVDTWSGAKRAGWEILELEHGLELPVGLGFSLTFLPGLLRPEIWHALEKAAFEAYLPHADRLRGLGIEIVNPKERASLSTPIRAVK